MKIQLNYGRVLHINQYDIFTFDKNSNYDHPAFPSYINHSGYMKWYKYSQCHRIGKAAVIFSDGTKMYYEYDHFIKEER